ncbi:hypothetical protein [Corynebacterium terpenotabidum]|uniref:Uncharacterized protein n=1 Tax=Corynebacterium terpenotabidum Y-11 TaxID=1200352 RepID=S4XEL5_9CORY|nr:hypothetical protein [Corynebacterium terpenotabidum]AGP30999.1 hypothetical protein A606_06760 [Corynebacterium terpenotabidum Y-11]
MEVLAIIGICIAFFAVSWVWGTISDGISAKANQHIFLRGSHKKGQAQLSTDVQFSTAQAPVEYVRESIMRTIPVEPGGMIKRAFALDVSRREDGGYNLLYSYGNKVTENFRTLVAISPGNGGIGSAGLITVIEALAVDGILTHPNEMKKWRQSVIAAIHATDASAQFMEIPA